MVYGLDCFLEESEQSFSAKVFCVEFVNMMWIGEQETDARKIGVMYRSGLLAHFFSIDRVIGQSPIWQLVESE